MPNKTGNSAHDANCQAAELTYQTTMASVTTQAAAHAADVARLTAIVNSGAQNGISTYNQQVALRSLMTTGNA
jgi:hypothetical protein